MSKPRPLMISLSKLVPSRKNPRKTKPDRDAHRKLIASVRTYDILQPLLVRALDGQAGKYQIIAGERRYDALRTLFRRTEPHHLVPCLVRDADDRTAEAMSLAENFPREAMHPLDEAEAFAHLAGEEGKHADEIAADFGVTATYVRQRMKLAALHDVVKFAYREKQLDTATAEAYAAIPPDRQVQVWEEVRSRPQHAELVRNVIATAWIDATNAIFDITQMPEGSVSRDLFSERVLVERQVFLAAQSEALQRERTALLEDGWSEVIVGARSDVQDRLYAMKPLDAEYDEETSRALQKLTDRRQEWEAKLGALEKDDAAKAQKIQQKINSLETEIERLLQDAKVTYSEKTKALGTVFLLLDPDGRVRREYRKSRKRDQGEGSGAGTNGSQTSDPDQSAMSPDHLRDGQLCTTFAHEAIAVRQAVLKDPILWKRILVLSLHPKVRREALAVGLEANSTTLHAEHQEGFTSPAWEELRKRFADADPFADVSVLHEVEAYDKLSKLSEPRLDKLIAVLAVNALSGHGTRIVELIRHLATALKVNVRNQWRPDAAWLGGYQKIQLSHLVSELLGPVHVPDPSKKKSELIESLVNLFAKAADGTLADRPLAERVNAWIPSNLRNPPESVE